MSAATATAAAVRAPLPRGSDSLRNALAAKGNPIADLILSKDDPRRARHKTAYAHVEQPNSRSGGADIPAFLDRRNNANAIPSDEGRSK